MTCDGPTHLTIGWEFVMESEASEEDFARSIPKFPIYFNIFIILARGFVATKNTHLELCFVYSAVIVSLYIGPTIKLKLKPYHKQKWCYWGKS